MPSRNLDLIQELLAGRTSVAEEARIIEILRGVDADDLNLILTEIDADRFVAGVDDHLFFPDHRSQLFELLVARQRELELKARAAVIHALQTGPTRLWAERIVADLICGVTGETLTHLKNTLNARRDVHDLEGLVFSDIGDEGVRKRILDHIAAQAASVQPHEAKVLSDIDDTAFAKLHDDRYPRGTVYPGVAAFYEALDEGPDDEPFSMGDLTFLTARPMDAFGLIEASSHRALINAGIGTSSVLSGSFTGLLSKDLMAARKLLNVRHYRLLYPEYDIVFVGDSGQGDVTVAEGLYREYPDTVTAVFIHDVVDTAEAVRAEHGAHGIHFFDTYPGAATTAYELGLISAAGLREVLAETDAGLDTIAWGNPEQEAAARALTARDVAGALRALGEGA
ncbi:phosphatase domain-containing protein [Nigerium massiliense]|uniref:phosphatase domain-containing protein n=1 Tax=Nigerium massiliense TaxID=1522317 RepID=UPI00058D0E6C|nr:phosphatase domain-containing protein [Nigerium massiliense]